MEPTKEPRSIRFLDNMKQELPPSPFLKWAGGKRALLKEILPRIPNFEGTYFEPFLGAGAVFFRQHASRRKIVNDSNIELVQTYEVIRDQPTELLEELELYQNNKEYFLEVRSWDRDSSFESLSKLRRAARFIYLNRTCFNGLYRVNSAGYFNVPFGNYKNPKIADHASIFAVSAFLRRNVELSVGTYLDSTSRANAKDFIYFDPPYDPASPTASFVSYQSGGFTRKDQETLRDEIVRLTLLGAQVLVSNSDTEFINDLYSDTSIFKIEKVIAKRNISSSTKGRTPVHELLISNAPGCKSL